MFFRLLFLLGILLVNAESQRCPSKCRSKMSRIFKRINSLESQIFALKSDDDVQKRQIAAQKSQIVALESEDVAQKSQIVALESEDVAQKSQIVALESQIVAISSAGCNGEEVRNVALGAVAECSTIFSGSYHCGMAVDGIEECVWASRGEGVGNWIRLVFDGPRFLTDGRIMQRKVKEERDKDIKFEFSDGSVQQFQLPYRPEVGFVWDNIPLAPVKTTWVKITALSVWKSSNNGWAEIQLFARVRKDLPTPEVFGSLSRSDYIARCGP